MKTHLDPFRTSVMARSSVVRIMGVGIVLVGLWAAIAWAVALP